jgi:hypothetical protein|tara:strand:+ start:2457 stop:2942 length:486 start_codon:yes stop_codon:yes gene_type:complete
MKYDCSICGKKHEMYFGIKAELSQKISQMLENNPERVVESDGLYMIDKSKVVIPAQISIGTEFEEDFFYQTWVECDAKEFIKFSEEYKSERGGKISGKLYDNLIPYFPETINLKCLVEYRENMKSSDYPTIHIVEESELRSMQEKEISKVELETLMNRVYH